jgi:hypothetical protein
MDTNNLAEAMKNVIEVTPQFIFAVAMVAYIVQVIKGLPYANYLSPYLPIIAMAIGVVAAFGFHLANPILTGVAIGMAAVTGYCQFKATAKNGKQEAK